MHASSQTKKTTKTSQSCFLENSNQNFPLTYGQITQIVHFVCTNIYIQKEVRKAITFGGEAAVHGMFSFLHMRVNLVMMYL